MNRLFAIVIVLITMLVGGLIAYKLITGNHTKVKIVNQVGEKRLTQEELKELESQSGLSLPGQHQGISNSGNVPSDVNRTMETIKQIDHINQMNKEQQK